MIQLRQVEFTYPASSSSFRLAVDALTLDAGEKLAIVGPSGSGKTTLLNLLAGILVPNLGSVLVAGVDVSGLSEKERRDFRISNIGMVFQQFELLEYLTVADNIRLPFLINGSLSARESVPPADLLAAVGLAGFEKRYPRELSRGE
jgi:putative ABC transport system ATP-binding protein